MTEERRKELLENLKHVTEKDYFPGTKYPKGDREDWHVEADNILCDALDELGYHDLVEAWDEIPKWYA